MPRITVFQNLRGDYIADFAQATDAAEIRRLFGTTQIPTPFCRPAMLADVIADVAARNPGHLVTAQENSADAIR